MSGVLPHQISLKYYTLADLRTVVEHGCELTLAPDVREEIEKGASFVQRAVDGDAHVYGANTGFGALCETRIDASEMGTLQRNVILSHAAGVGNLTEVTVCRLTVLIKLLTFRTGRTGVSVGTVEHLIAFWNHDVIPAIPEKGTVGASGDLAPLAHMALPLLGLGRAYMRGQVIDGERALAELGLEPLRLGPKEGLALINGVQYVNAIAVHCLLKLEELLKWADLIASLSAQAFSTSRTFYQPVYVGTSLHPERGVVARNLQKLLDGSNHFELSTSNRSQQDPYSFRCIPQVHGAVRQAFAFARDVIEKECNGVSDNPLFFAEREEVLCGGNLHGESTAFALDFLAIATSELASISERRTYQLLSGQRGLPSFLVREPGLNSGLMVTQYTAAALVNQNKVLSTPASVDTIPTCQLQEDHVSMAGTSGHKLREIIDNCWYVLAIELVAAAQALDLQRELRVSSPAMRLLAEFRKHVRFLERDRIVSKDLEVARDFLREQGTRWFADLELE